MDQNRLPGRGPGQGGHLRDLAPSPSTQSPPAVAVRSSRADLPNPGFPEVFFADSSRALEIPRPISITTRPPFAETPLSEIPPLSLGSPQVAVHGLPDCLPPPQSSPEVAFRPIDPATSLNPVLPSDALPSIVQPTNLVSSRPTIANNAAVYPDFSQYYYTGDPQYLPLDIRRSLGLASPTIPAFPSSQPYWTRRAISDWAENIHFTTLEKGPNQPSSPSIKSEDVEMAPRILPQTSATRQRRAREGLARLREAEETHLRQLDEQIQAMAQERAQAEAQKKAQEAQARQARLDRQTQATSANPPSSSISESSSSAGPRDAVIDYLAKKGYSRTEAMLRMESANQEIDGRPLPQLGEDSRPKTRQGFDLLKNWVEENLDIYKPELRRVLWPLFVYSFFNLVTSFYPQDAKSFFEANKNMFLPEHTDYIRQLEPISLPEHLQDNALAKIYRNSKYRISLSEPAFTNLIQFLESKDKEGGSVMNAILSSYCTVKTKERSAEGRLSLGNLLNNNGDDFPIEDEGIPGHHPGSAYTGDNPAMAGTLPRLRLGKLPMEQMLEEDVRAELEDEDKKEAPVAGRSTLIQTFDEMIKKEEDDESPSRADIPYPPSLARNVEIEVQKVIEHRDRFKINARTGGVGPGVSVCMFTFHNTFDNMTCFDISDDNVLIAGGFMTSYIRIWTLDGTNLPRSGPEFDNVPDANSRRLIGHSGPIYSVAFPPCASARENVSAEDRIYTGPSWLLSSSADKSIRLWNLDAWQCIALYKGHDRPVWDLSWGPYGHYFVSGGSDNTARLWVSDHIRQQRIFAGHDQDVEVVCFHPNSAYVFTASCDHTVRMWAVTTGNAVRMFTGGHTGNITAMECSRDGKLLASADDHGIITLWDLAPGRILKRMRGHAKGGIWSLSWSVESTVLVSGGADGTVRIWDVAGPQETGRVLEVSGAGKLLDAGPAPTGQSKKKKGKETVITPDQIVAFPTKKTPVYKVKFTNMNLVLAAGCFQPS